MVSITNQSFPVANGEDGMRVARAFVESRTPAPGTAGHRLLEAYKKRCEARGSKYRRKGVYSTMAINSKFITDFDEDELKAFDCGDSAYATMSFSA